MKKLCSLLVLSVFALSLFAQTNAQAIKENQIKLTEISQNFVNANPDNKIAFDTHLMYTEQKKAYENHLNEVSNNSYSVMGLRDQASYERQNAKSDRKGQAMAQGVNKSFKTYKQYFSKVSIPFKNQVRSFHTQLRSGSFGKKGSLSN